MIHDSTLEAVYPLAEKLATRGIRVTPMANTPLATLVQAGHMPMPTRGVDENMLPMTERILRGSQSRNAQGAVEHDLAMEEVTEVVSATVRRNLDLARNVINPIVKEVAEEASQHVTEADEAFKARVAVVPVFYPSIWNSPTLTDLVERYNETALENLAFDVAIPLPGDGSKAELLELAKTGGGSFDREIESLFDALDESKVVDIYETVFRQKASMMSPRNINEFIRVTSIDVDSDMATRALLTHLWARKLVTNIPDGVDAPLSVYNSYLISLQAQTGRLIHGIMQRRDTGLRQRQLITRWPAGASMLGQPGGLTSPVNIRVNGEVYNQWLKEGGEPEVILGSFVSDQERTYTGLMDNKDRYLREWQRKERVLGTATRLNRFNHAVDGLRSAVKRQIKELDEEQLLVARSALNARLETILKDLSGKFYEDMYTAARKVVCQTLFPHTMGLKILTAIDNCHSDFPNIEIREAALLATIEIVAEWVGKLCRVESHSVTA